MSVKFTKEGCPYPVGRGKEEVTDVENIIEGICFLSEEFLKKDELQTLEKVHSLLEQRKPISTSMRRELDEIQRKVQERKKKHHEKYN